MNDHTLGYQILESGFVGEERGSIKTIDTFDSHDGWMFGGDIYKHKSVVTVENNRPAEGIWPGTNTHYGFKIGIWDSETLKYIEDMRDPFMIMMVTVPEVPGTH